MLDCHETSLSKLSDHDFQILKSRWNRGIDWIVHRCGRKWELISDFGNFPLFDTKSAAYDAGTNLILIESRYRASRAIS